MKPGPHEIADLLREIANALELGKGNTFRARAYRKGAMALESISGDLDSIIAADRLTETPGIGAALSAQIAEIRRTGESSYLKDLAAALPPGAIALSKIPEISARMVQTLSDAGYRTVEEVEAAARENKLRGLRGIGPKTEERLLEKIRAPKLPEDRGTILRDARVLAKELGEYLRGENVARTVDLVGDARRAVEVVAEVQCLATGDDTDAILERFEQYARLATTDPRGDREAAGTTWEGSRLRLFVRSPAARFAALQRLTGSEAHNRELDDAAMRAGISIDDDGVRTKDADAPLAMSSEKAVYAAARVEWVPPPIREGTGETRAAPRLVEREDIRGAVHCHTQYSDGRHTIAEMVRAAEKRGLSYITITDHSPTAHYAGGVEIDRLKQQWEEIDRVQETTKVRILRGTECDILKDGALDYPDEILEKLDVIIASIHNRYRLDEPGMTRRILAAITHPFFKVWGHPLGRLLLSRPPVDCDLDRILETAARSRVAIEMSGDPHRLDLPPLLAQRARALDIPFVVSTDAHAMRDLDNLELGILMAQRAGLSKSDVLNALGPDEFAARVRPR